MPIPPHDKPALLESLRALVTVDLETLEKRQRDTAAGVTHEDNRAEHAKDTRATEDSYLARGLAERVADLQRIRDGLGRLDLRVFAADAPIAATALVTLRFDDAKAPERWFVIPGAGGFELTDASGVVRTVTPVAPLGRALLGREAGDEGTLSTPRGPRTFEVLAVE